MRNKKAFTLIEVLVVGAILGLLATLSVQAFSNAGKKMCQDKEYYQQNRKLCIERLKDK